MTRSDHASRVVGAGPGHSQPLTTSPSPLAVSSSSHHDGRILPAPALTSFRLPPASLAPSLAVQFTCSALNPLPVTPLADRGSGSRNNSVSPDLRVRFSGRLREHRSTDTSRTQGAYPADALNLVVERGRRCHVRDGRSQRPQFSESRRVASGHDEQMSDDEFPMTDAGRQSRDILLDAISAWDGADPNNFVGPDLAVQRLLEVGAVKAAMNEETGDIDVDISPVLQGRASPC